MTNLRGFIIIFFVFNFFSQISFGQNFPKIKIESLKDFTKKDSIRLFEEIKLLEEKVLKNPVFWEEIKTSSFGCTNRRIYQSTRSRRCEYPKLPKDTHDYTSQEIHDLLFFGQDEIGSEKDSVINLKLRLYGKQTSRTGKIIHGKTSSCSLTIASSRKTRLFTPEKGNYAIHILHEYMHILGFKHISNKRKRNKRKCGGDDVAWGIQMIAKKYMFEVN